MHSLMHPLMDPLIATAALIAIGAITPGPNNLIVLREASAKGFKGALIPSAGVVVGGLALLAVVSAGAGALFERDPRLAVALGVGACAVLAALGLRAIRGSFRDASARATDGQADAVSFAGLVTFQFLNPKAWVLVVAAVASMGGAASSSMPGESGATGSLLALAQLAVLFLLIPGLGLALWSLAGALLMRWLERPLNRRLFDRLTGVLLIGFAVLLSTTILEVL